jgi:two-component system, NarL family, nitrate/nitrite response regulator NarL
VVPTPKCGVGSVSLASRSLSAASSKIGKVPYQGGMRRLWGSHAAITDTGNLSCNARLEGPNSSEQCGESQMVSVVCVVIHPSRVARKGFEAILANSPFNPVRTVASIEEVPHSLTSAGEQLLILMGVREAAHLAQALSVAKANFPEAPVVVIGDACDRELVVSALAAGATTFIDENADPSTLIKELELVAQGEPVISVLIMQRLLQQGPVQASGHAINPIIIDQRRQLPEPEDKAESKPQLSGREAAIMRALVEGASNKVIASRLCITEASVKVHVKAILRKIRAKNRTQAAIWAMRHETVPKLDPGGKKQLRRLEGASTPADDLEMYDPGQ